MGTPQLFKATIVPVFIFIHRSLPFIISVAFDMGCCSTIFLSILCTLSNAERYEKAWKSKQTSLRAVFFLSSCLWQLYCCRFRPRCALFSLAQRQTVADFAPIFFMSL